MDRDIQLDAVVTGTRRFGEMHKSVELFSLQKGLISAVVFGGRKGKNASLAPLFASGKFQLYYNPVKDEYTLKEQSLSFCPDNITSDIKSTYTASYFCEVINCINTDAFDSYYNLLVSSLSILEEHPEKSRKILIDFSLKMLILSGLETDFASCPVCEKEYTDNQSLLFSTSMTVPCCEKCADTDRIKLSPGCRKYLRYTMNMDIREAFQVEIFDSTQTKLTEFLTSWVSLFCSKPLKTVKSGLL